MKSSLRGKKVWAPLPWSVIVDQKLLYDFHTNCVMICFIVKKEAFIPDVSSFPCDQVSALYIVEMNATDSSHMDKVGLTSMLETLHHPFKSFLLFPIRSFLPPSSTSTTLHQCGLSTRRALQCFSTQCARLRRLHPSRCLATTSCRSHLLSSLCLKPPCSRGQP